jgi:NAD+ synthase
MHQESLMEFNRNVLKIDPAAEADRIVAMLREAVHQKLRRYGAVIGISGGVDSSVVLALCVRAFGPKQVVAVMLPEMESDPKSEQLACLASLRMGVEPILEDITSALEGFGCYRRRDEAINRVFPEYDPDCGYKAKITLPKNLLDEDTLNVFYATVITPEGIEKQKRLSIADYLQIVAASNFKQRTRMAELYYQAELHNFAVIGTANKNEYEQGFFVKHGDSGVDVKPIAHLFKSQVYQLAEYLDIPEEIRTRPPSTDTYSASCTQEEFFFRLPFEIMDLLWYAQENEFPIELVTREMDLTEIQVQRAYREFLRKKRTTEYLRMQPVDLVKPEGISAGVNPLLPVHSH